MHGEGVFVIPIEREIDMSAFRHLRRGVGQAGEANAQLVLIKLNTFGGALDAADSIRTTLMRLSVPTVAFVDVNAASAGALIALACDSVYMSPAASMGAATVVNGAGEPMPEKYQSYMSAIMCATAERHGKVALDDSMVWRRNPDIAASMVNPGESVSMTAAQAVECGYAEGIAPDIEAVLANLDMADVPVTYYSSSLADDIIGFLSNSAVRAVLVMLILGGIYMEMHTPGLGFAAAVSCVAAVLYFLPMFIVGAMPSWVLLCLLAGVVLIVFEIFVVPGFGVTGISGILAIMAAITGAAADDAVTGFNLSSFVNALWITGLGCLAAFVLVFYLTSSHGPACFRRHSELMTELSAEKGFIGVDMSLKGYVGKTAMTVTDMRPAGKIRIDEEVFDAVSTGEFIPANHKVAVLRHENAQLYVAKI